MEQQPNLDRRLEEAKSYLQSQLEQLHPQLLLVLGSGLNHVAEQVEGAQAVPFEDVPFMAHATVAEHVGRFVYGSLGGKRVLVMQGRLHGYEGHTAQQVAFPVWLAHRLGARVLFTTNAAGGIDPRLAPGDFCIMSDHINFTGRNPIACAEATAWGPRFFSMEGAYDPDLRATALRVAQAEGIRAQEGVYLGLLGPSFETPAEIRAFASWGASTVAMSVCEEVIAARQVGMRVLGMSMISNYAAGLGPAELTAQNFEEELAGVFEIAGEAASRLIAGIVSALEL